MRAVTSRVLFSLSSETQALVRTMTVRPEASRVKQYDTTIRALKNAGIWTKRDLVYLVAGHDSQAARLNCKAPGTGTLTLTLTPTFVADRGYIGDATNGLDGPLFSTLTKFARDDANLSVWSLTSAGAVTDTAGLYFGLGGDTSLQVRSAIDTNFGAINQAAGAGIAPASTDGIGYFYVQRTASNAIAVGKNGAQTATGADASSAPNADAVVYMAYATVRCAALLIGQSLTTAELAAEHAILRSWMQSVGAV